MRRTMLSGTAAVALAALLSIAPGIAGADTQTTTDTQNNTQAQTTTETTTETTTDAEVTTEAEADAQKGIDAADLMGDSVENSAGDVLGDIETLVVADDGSIEHVVLGVGGFLGIGEKEVALPWDRFTVKPEEDRIVAEVSREELEALPEFDWPEDYQTGTLLSPLPAQSTDNATTTEPTTEQTASTETTTEQTADTTTAEETDAAEVEAELQPIDQVLAGNVIGAQIVAANGEEIGEVDDVVISADGTAQGVVTEIGGFLGVDEKQVMISWSDLDPRQDADGDLVLQVKLDAAALEALPNYDYDQASK
jgi:sporulation protein YlmC with PRC-barrel domain